MSISRPAPHNFHYATIAGPAENTGFPHNPYALRRFLTVCGSLDTPPEYNNLSVFTGSQQKNAGFRFFA